MGLFDFAKDILGVAEAGAGIMGLFSSRKKSGAEKMAEAQMERANMLSQALSNPNDPNRRNMAENKLQELRRARLEGIRDFVGASARSARRLPSGPGFISRNPRRDEALARALMASGQNEWASADEMAKADIATALTGNLQSAQGARSMVPIQWEGAQRQASMLPSALSAGRDIAGALGRVWTGLGGSGGGIGGGVSPVAVSINDPSALGPSRRNVTTSNTGGLLGWV